MSDGAAIFRDDQQVLPLKRPMGGEGGRRLLAADRLDKLHDVLHAGSHPDNDGSVQRHARGASYRVCVSALEGSRSGRRCSVVFLHPLFRQSRPSNVEFG